MVSFSFGREGSLLTSIPFSSSSCGSFSSSSLSKPARSAAVWSSILSSSSSSASESPDSYAGVALAFGAAFAGFDAAFADLSAGFATGDFFSLTSVTFAAASSAFFTGVAFFVCLALAGAASVFFSTCGFSFSWSIRSSAFALGSFVCLTETASESPLTMVRLAVFFGAGFDFGASASVLEILVFFAATVGSGAPG